MLRKYREGTPYRINFRFAGADRRIALRQKDDLSEADIDAWVKRLHPAGQGEFARAMDQASAGTNRPQSGGRLNLLAAEMGLDRPVFKIDIRKLKGVRADTESLGVGYRLSPRGKRLLAHLRTLDTRETCSPRGSHSA